MFIENGTRVKFNNGGDPARIQKVQVATGRDLQRAPRVFATNDGRGAKQIQVVTGGFTLAAHGGGLDRFGNLQALEAIVFPTAHDAATRARVISYMMGVGGVA